MRKTAATIQTYNKKTDTYTNREGIGITILDNKSSEDISEGSKKQKTDLIIQYLKSNFTLSIQKDNRVDIEGKKYAFRYIDDISDNYTIKSGLYLV